MEKNTYQTYEYMPANNAETDCDQFFIIEDDGTYLTAKPVQYVTQAQESKSELEKPQPNPVYDVTPQHVLVDVDNSNDFIVPDNLVIPDGNGGLFANSYFLQTAANTNEQVEQDDSNQFRQTDMQLDETSILSSGSRQNTTEIMLTDEQYGLLQQKGWIMLELNNRIFVLDTSGLQDITNNHELIQQLKAEIQSNAEFSSSMDDNESKVKIEGNTDSQEPLIPNAQIELENETNFQSKAKSLDKTLCATNEIDETTFIDVINHEAEILKSTRNEIQVHTVGDAIKIKTQLLLKDIPDKIVLGKTVNGKKLVAKLVPKLTDKTKSVDDPVIPKPKQPAPSLPSFPDANNLPDWQFKALVEHAQSDDMKCSEEQVAAAREVVGQLLQVAAFQRAVAGKNLFITRAVKQKSSELLSETVTQSVVVGIISEINGEQQFVHIPNMMRNLANTGDQDPHYITHVHVTETKTNKAQQTVSITVNKRPLPKGKRPSKVYACSTCASTFISEKELIDHQEAHCIDAAEEPLTIDTEILNNEGEPWISNTYNVIRTDKGIIYSCEKCPLKFNKLCNCLRHLKTHSGPTTKTDKDAKDPTEKTHKCKMCSSSYYYASTLSKHILATHINVNTDNN